MAMEPHDLKTYGSWLDYMGGSVYFRPKSRDWFGDIYSEKHAPPYYNKIGQHSFKKITWVQTPGYKLYKTIYKPTGEISSKRESGFWPANEVVQLTAPATPEETDVDAVALAKALDKFTNSIRGDTDLSIDTAQYRQTLGIAGSVRDLVQNVLSLKNPASLIRQVMKKEVGVSPKKYSKRYLRFVQNRENVKRKAEAGLIMYAKIPAQARLQWVYGIKPTLQSIYDAVWHLSSHYNKEFKIFESKAWETITLSDINESYFAWPLSEYNTTVDRKFTVMYKLGCLMRIPDSPLTEVARLASLNPVSIAWELMPYSFVVDWVFDIGGYLRNLETALVYQSYFVRGYKTRMRITETECDSRLASYYDNGLVIYINRGRGHFKQKIVELSRVPLASYPYPKPPRLNAKLGSGQLLNAAALLAQFLGRGSKRPGSEYQRALRGKF